MAKGGDDADSILSPSHLICAVFTKMSYNGYLVTKVIKRIQFERSNLSQILFKMWAQYKDWKCHTVSNELKKNQALFLAYMSYKRKDSDSIQSKTISKYPERDSALAIAGFWEQAERAMAHCKNFQLGIRLNRSKPSLEFLTLVQK